MVSSPICCVDLSCQHNTVIILYINQALINAPSAHMTHNKDTVMQYSAVVLSPLGSTFSLWKNLFSQIQSVVALLFFRWWKCLLTRPSLTSCALLKHWLPTWPTPTLLPRLPPLCRQSCAASPQSCRKPSDSSSTTRPFQLR